MSSLSLKLAILLMTFPLAACIGNNPSASSSSSSSSGSAISSSGSAGECPEGKVKRPSISGQNRCLFPHEQYSYCSTSNSFGLATNTVTVSGSNVSNYYSEACGPLSSSSSTSSGGSPSSTSSTSSSGSGSTRPVAEFPSITPPDGFHFTGCLIFQPFSINELVSDATEQTVFNNQLLISQKLGYEQLSFEIFLEGDEPKTLAVTAGRRLCWERKWSATDFDAGTETQFINLETRTIQPGTWQKFESSSPTGHISGHLVNGMHIRALEAPSKFRVRHLQLTGNDGEMKILIP